MRLYTRVLGREEVADLYTDSLTGASKLLLRPVVPILIGGPIPTNPPILFATSPARLRWQAQILRLGRIVSASPGRLTWQARSLTVVLGRTIAPAQVMWRVAQAFTGTRVVLLPPVQMPWRAMESTARILDLGLPYPTAPLSFPLHRRWTHKPGRSASVDWRHPLAQGLICCYLFNEGQGTTLYDLTGNQHDVTIGLGSGDSTWMTWTAGMFGGAAGPVLAGQAGTGSLDQDLGNMRTPLVLPAGGTWTIELWILVEDRYPLNSTFGRVFFPAFPAIVPAINYFPGVGLQYQDDQQLQMIRGPAQQWTHMVFVKRRREYLAEVFPQPLLEKYANGELLQLESGGRILDTAIRWNKFLHSSAQSPFTGTIGLCRIWDRDLNRQEVFQLYAQPYEMFTAWGRGAVFHSERPVSPPARLQWQAQVARIPRIFLVEPVRVQWEAQELPFTGTLSNPVPSRVQWQAQPLQRSVTVEVVPARLQWRTVRQQLPIGLNLRDCGEEYETALQKTSIGGDWLISAPGIGLFVSFNYEGGGGWEHRIVDISDIEISAPPGGGIASVANVTVSIAETGGGQSIVTLWEQASAVGAVRVTIDFLLAGAEQVLRIFTGTIDSIVVKDAVAQLLLVDDSIQRNLIIPKEIVTVEEYPNADQAALTKAIPLVYGQGSKIGAAPLLLVDVAANVYLLAAHPMRVGGSLAVYDEPTKTFLTLPNIILIPNNANATITLGTLDAGPLRLWDSQGGVVNPTAAIDGTSTTLTVVGTDINGAVFTYQSAIQPGDGWGYCRWGFGNPGVPLAGTLKVDLTNHRRSPGSTPTVTGTFYCRTVDAQLPLSVEHRFLMVSPAFRHTISAQNNTFILSNVNIGLHEIFEVLLITRCEGQIGAAWQTYEVGEVSITPLVAFTADISGTPTAVGLPINLQDLRFNTQRPALSVYVASYVTNPTHALDGNSTGTWAQILTTGLDSNLDGYGELIVTADVTAAQRGNNTVSIDLIGHRRALTSTPTVTGTFSIQTYNTATGVLLRDNLFVTQAFRHQTNPITTSYVATAINLGATTQLAVRAVARNEGGVGSAGQIYEVREIDIQTFYQPRGDSGEVYLFGEGYEGRTDLLGTVTDYLGSEPGRLYQTPDMVIASIYEDELGLGVDLESFAAAYNFFAGFEIRFDGGIGAGWALEQANARDILDAMARQSTAILFPTFEATWGIRPFRSNLDVHQAFDASTILTESGSEQTRPEDRNSTVQVTFGNLQNVYNHFEVRYKYNVGSNKYDGVYRVTKDGSNLPTGAIDKAEIELTCLKSWLRYGDLEPLIVEAPWIADDASAAYFLRHLALYFSQQRLGVQFETTFKAACLQVGDFITITDNSLPVGDNGGVFEVHTIRYMPLRGRIQLTTSRVSVIPDVALPVAPAVLTGCAKFADSMRDGMVACWDFDEVSGTRIDHLQEYALTTVNTPAGVPGKIGNAVQILRAQVQYLRGENLLAGAFTGAFTIAVWVRLLSVPSEWQGIVVNEDAYPNREIFFGVGDGGFLHVGVGNSNGGGQLCANDFSFSLWKSLMTLPYTGTAADWTLLRVWRTCDASFSGTLTLQMNNDPAISTVFTGAVPHAYNHFTVGASEQSNGGTAYYGNFLLDQLMVWRRALSQAELDAIWNGGLG